MLPARCARTATLFILALCAAASWYPVLSFLPQGPHALSTASAESPPRQVRDTNAATSGPSAQATESAEDSRDLEMRDSKFNDKATKPDPKSFPNYGTIKHKLVSLIAEDDYHFIAYMPLRTASGVMVEVIETFDDLEIIEKFARSRSFSVELYPDLKKGHDFSEGYCMVEYTFSFMGDESGIAGMMCLIFPYNEPNYPDPYFITKDVPHNTVPYGRESRGWALQSKAFVVTEVNLDTSCVDFDHEMMYRRVFVPYDMHVNEKIGYRRKVYIDDVTYSIRRKARMEFIQRLHRHMIPRRCKKDKALNESIKKYKKLNEDSRFNIKNRNVDACPQNFRNRDYADPLLNREEMAALRTFDIYKRTNLQDLLNEDKSKINITRGECMLDALAHSKDLSAEYKLERGHYVRIEYFKKPDKKGLSPGDLLYISIDIFGSVDVVLLIGRPPDRNNPKEYNDYIRTIEHKTQPHFSDIAHVIRAKSFVNDEYSPPNKLLSKKYLSGFQLICRNLIDEEMPIGRELDKYANMIYNSIFRDTKLEGYLSRGGMPSHYPKHIDTVSNQSMITSDISEVRRLRKEFLRRVISKLNCRDFIPPRQYEPQLLPMLFRPEYYNRNTYIPPQKE